MIFTQTETTKLTLKIGGVETSWEIQGTDCNVSEIIHGFYGIIVAQTFQPGSIANCMKEFGEDQLEALSYSQTLFSKTDENQE